MPRFRLVQVFDRLAAQRLGEAYGPLVPERSWSTQGARQDEQRISGATLDRPALEALRDLVASGAVDTVLVWSVDRLSRNFAYQILLQEEFARAGAEVVFVQEPDDATPQGMLLRQMLSVISEYERTQIVERSRRGKLHRARQGSLNMLTRAPYGYRLIPKTEDCGARLEIDNAEAGVYARSTPLSPRGTEDERDLAPARCRRGATASHAARWSTSTVAVILRNEAYIGKAAYLKTTSTGKRTRPNRTGSPCARVQYGAWLGAPLARVRNGSN